MAVVIPKNASQNLTKLKKGRRVVAYKSPIRIHSSDGKVPGSSLVVQCCEDSG